MGAEESRPRYVLVPPVFERRRPRRLVQLHEREYYETGREIHRLLHDLYTTNSTVSGELFASPQEGLDCYAEIHHPRTTNSVEGSALFTVRQAPLTVEGLLSSKNGGTASVTLGHTTKDESTTTFVATEYATNRPGVSSSTRLKGGVFYRYRQLSGGVTVSSPLDLTLNAIQRGNIQHLSDHVDGHAWTLFKRGTTALGAACRFIDGRVDSVDGVVCFRNQWLRPDEPCTELTLRATQRVNGLPSFHGSYYQRMVTRRAVKNPFEEAHVQYITNYVDLGIEADVSSTGTTMSVGAAWQVNKNVLVKGKVDDTAFSLVYAAKSWWDPSATASLTVSAPFRGSNGPRLGLSISIENWGGIGYEKVASTYKRYIPLQMEPVDDATEPDTEDNFLRRIRMK